MYIWTHEPIKKKKRPQYMTISMCFKRNYESFEGVNNCCKTNRMIYFSLKQVTFSLKEVTI